MVTKQVHSCRPSRDAASAISTRELLPWLDQDTPPELRKLLVAARLHAPTPSEVRRASVALGVTLSASSLVAVKHGAGATAGAKLSALWSVKSALLTSAVGTVVAGAVVGILHLSPTATQSIAPETSSGVRYLPHTRLRSLVPAPQASVSSQSSAAAYPSRPAPKKPIKHRSQVLHESEPRDPPEPPGLEVPSSVTQPRVPQKPAAPSQGSYIDHARKAMIAGRYLETLGIIDQYDREFPRGTFRAEALQLRMWAHEHTGNKAGAKGMAMKLIVEFPNTPQAKDAIQYLE